MSAVVVRARDLGKRYRIGVARRGAGDVRSAVAAAAGEAVRAVRALVSRNGDGNAGAIWALKDVSFDIAQGEIVGIIGRNGAGKSTLLKILARITEPTTGVVELRGRVGSLLEVGTGFHQELTGRENVFLNAAVLGMRQAEVARRFDEIVAFAGIEQFTDTPVKHYSSGMYLRLAFAVAAHLEAEILLMDEVLAVGDTSFQKKCLNKMQDVGRSGRTVLFVSHNMSAITRLCDRTILLDGGVVVADGPSHKVVSTYLRSGVGSAALREWPELETAPGNDVVRLRAVRVRTEDGRVTDAVDIRRPVAIDVEFDVLQGGQVLVPNLHLYNEEGICVFITGDQDPEWRRRERPEGRFISTAWIPGNFLAEGSLIVHAAISTPDPVTVHAFERDAVAFQVIDSLGGETARGDYGGEMPGVVRPVLSWTTDFSPAHPRATVS
ncbi:MAG: polysaccharide ABC transporter ATP-binding protein [Gemmatimonadaceae bacterium]